MECQVGRKSSKSSSLVQYSAANGQCVHRLHARQVLCLILFYGSFSGKVDPPFHGIQMVLLQCQCQCSSLPLTMSWSSFSPFLKHILAKFLTSIWNFNKQAINYRISITFAVNHELSSYPAILGKIWIYQNTLQEIQFHNILSSITLYCQVTMIVMF